MRLTFVKDDAWALVQVFVVFPILMLVGHYLLGTTWRTLLVAWGVLAVWATVKTLWKASRRTSL